VKTTIQDLEIIPFRPEFQAAARALVLAGLAEHWKTMETDKNPDLDDIAAFYQSGLFLIARSGDTIIATGAYLPGTHTTAEIVRMSVQKEMRRKGIGRLILDELCKNAAKSGYRRLILETTASWQGAVAFYLSYGFRMTHHQAGNTWFELPRFPGDFVERPQ